MGSAHPTGPKEQGKPNPYTGLLPPSSRPSNLTPLKPSPPPRLLYTKGMPPPSTKPHREQQILSVVRRYWGFDSLRPLQTEAIEAALAGRDSLVVMPTGGGKSLCYQVPPAVDGATDVVVSPLISLMKDQVDGLRTCGYPAACLHSGLSPQERANVEDGLAAGKVPAAVHRAGTADGPLVLANGRAARTFAGSRSTKPIASATGDTIFGPSIGNWPCCGSGSRRPACMRSPRRPRRACKPTSRPSSACANRPSWSGRFDRPNLVYRILPQVDRDAADVGSHRRHRGRGRDRLLPEPQRHRSPRPPCCTGNGVKAAAYHAGFRPRSGIAPKKRSPKSGSTWSWPPWLSAWGSTGATCAACCMPRCRSRSSIISRRPAARAAMAWRRNACCSIRRPTPCAGNR